MLSPLAIEAVGFARVGAGAQISDRASFYGAERIELGSNVRIDDFCVLSAGLGGICIGRNVHIAVYSSLIGAGKITLSDFCNISSRVSIYSSSDDHSGGAMTNPTVSTEFTAVKHADVFLGKHVLVFGGSIILPGVKLEDGVVVGALSLIKTDCKAFGIYAGNPARRINERRRDLLAVEMRFTASGDK